MKVRRFFLCFLTIVLCAALVGVPFFLFHGPAAFREFSGEWPEIADFFAWPKPETPFSPAVQPAEPDVPETADVPPERK